MILFYGLRVVAYIFMLKLFVADFLIFQCLYVEDFVFCLLENMVAGYIYTQTEHGKRMRPL